jgi:hypothetical protein
MLKHWYSHMKDTRCVAFPLRSANISHIDFHVIYSPCVPVWTGSNNTHYTTLEWRLKAYSERPQVLISINTGKPYCTTPTTICHMIPFCAAWKKNNLLSASDDVSRKIHNV